MRWTNIIRDVGSTQGHPHVRPVLYLFYVFGIELQPELKAIFRVAMFLVSVCTTLMQLNVR